MKIYQKIFIGIIIFLTWLALGSRLLFCGPKNDGFRIFEVVENLWHLGLIAKVAEKEILDPVFKSYSKIIIFG